MPIPGHRSRHLRIAWLCFFALSLSLSSEADDDRVSREAVEALEAYAVYKLADYETAWKRFLVLAEKGNAQGMLNVANMRLAGLGVERDAAAAFEWYRRAAKAGDAIGMLETARAYELGRGVAIDVDAAIDVYRRAADAGSREAARALGRLLREQGDDAAARDWLQRAADAGDAVASRMLGMEEGATAGLSGYVDATVRNAWQAIDRAAAAGNAAGVVYYLTRDAEVRVRLPNARAPISMDKPALDALWQRSFKAPGGHRIRRSTPTVVAIDEGIYRVDSVLLEELIDGAGRAQRLRIQESARVRVVDDRVVIERLDLDIEAMDDTNR